MKKLYAVTALFVFFNVYAQAAEIYEGPCRDKNSIYYNIEKIGDINTNKAKFFDTEGMDEEYRNFVNGYLMSEEAVYYNGKKLSGTDSRTFDYVSDFYTKDKNNVYYNNIKIKNSDPETFEYIKYRYAKDKNSVYYSGKKIKNADVKTFEIVDFYRAKDKNKYYMHGEAE